MADQEAWPAAAWNPWALCVPWLPLAETTFFRRKVVTAAPRRRLVGRGEVTRRATGAPALRCPHVVPTRLPSTARLSHVDEHVIVSSKRTAAACLHMAVVT